MSHRDSFVENIKTFRSRERAEFEDAIEREEREKIEAPLREAETKLKATATELGLKMREIVLSGPDPEWTLPEDARGSMPAKKAFEFSVSEAQKFCSNEEFKQYDTQQNRDAIAEYLDRNGTNVIVSETCFRQAFERLRSLGIISEKHVEPTPAPESQPIPEVLGEVQPKPKYTGIDGREYTDRDLWRMSSDDMKRTFGLFGANMPTIEKALSGQ